LIVLIYLPDPEEDGPGPWPFVDYEPATISIAAINESLAFLAAEESLRTARQARKAKPAEKDTSTPLLASQGYSRKPAIPKDSRP
jgi:hypothetical protein